jgi:glutamyl-tRNA synthetase
MQKQTRVRFAPSPTGFLHIGGMRSALFNWLFARKSDGVFMLRMEDTDRERYVPEAVKQIKDSHDWLGLTPDESAVQSERLDIYKQHSEQLVENGQLYRCWCSPERLDKLRETARAARQPFKYDRHCLTSPGDPDKPHVLRFKIGDTPKSIAWDDAVRDHMEFETGDLDDFVCIKTDGYPTYNFANVVDDHEMEISHVMRAEEFLASTPKHLLLYAAFGWEPPVFAHMPQVLGPDGKSKLSKRHGAQSVLEYRDQGYLPDAIINFMAQLGWNEGSGSTKEIYSRQELIEAFTLERIQKSPAIFDPERLTWLNGVYIRSLAPSELAKLSEPFWSTEAKSSSSEHKLQILGLIQERLKFLAEIPELTDFFFTDPDPKALKQFGKLQPSESKRLLEASLEVLGKSTFEHDSLEKALRALADELDVKTGALFGVLRIAITGKVAAPGLFETMVALGEDSTLRRLKAATSALR